MSKRKHEEQELPFVALMDTMTNVVGVLIIVLVMVGLSVTSAVKKVLSDLPPVTPEELKEITQQVKELPKLLTPEEIKEKQKQAEAALKKAIALGGHTISLAQLHEASMRKIDRQNASFWAAIHRKDGDDALGMLERQRVKTWLKNSYATLDTLPLG